MYLFGLQSTQESIINQVQENGSPEAEFDFSTLKELLDHIVTLAESLPSALSIIFSFTGVVADVAQVFRLVASFSFGRVFVTFFGFCGFFVTVRAENTRYVQLC